MQMLNIAGLITNLAPPPTAPITVPIQPPISDGAVSVGAAASAAQGTATTNPLLDLLHPSQGNNNMALVGLIIFIFWKLR